MNIGIISSDALPVPPARYGGTERVVWWLSVALADLDHKVTLFAKEGSRRPPGGRLYTIDGTEAGFIPLFKDAMVSLDVAVDMSHNKTVASRFPDFPILSRYPCMNISWPRNTVCISDAQRIHLKLSDDIPVIYTGLDADEYPLYEGKREDYLLYLGAVLPGKQVPVAIQIAEAAGVPLKICGPVGSPEYFNEAIRPHLTNDIQYIGEVGGLEKLDLLQRARAVVHPVGGPGSGLVEPGGIVVLEALHVGTPVVCSNSGCLPHYIQQGKNGFICDTIWAYKKAVAKCGYIEPRVCRRTVEYYRKERMAREYVDLLRSLLGPEGRRW